MGRGSGPAGLQRFDFLFQCLDCTLGLQNYQDRKNRPRPEQAKYVALPFKEVTDNTENAKACWNDYYNTIWFVRLKAQSELKQEALLTAQRCLAND